MAGMDGADETYDPSAFARGGVSRYAESRHGDAPDGGEVADKAGLAGKHAGFSLRLKLADGTIVAPLYSDFRGAPFMDAGETAIEIRFGGALKLGGGWQPEDSDWLAVIAGKRLKKIFFDVSEGKRISVHCCVADGGIDPQVDRVEVFKIEAE